MLPSIIGLLSIGLPKVKTVSIIKKTQTAGAAAASVQTIAKVRLGQTLHVKAFVFASGTNRAVIEVTAAVKNVGGATALVGAASVITLRDGASIAATLVANNTADSIDLQVTADADNDTVFSGYAVVTEQP